MNHIWETNLFRHALQEIIPACACVRNHPLVCALTGENDSIRPRTASGIDLIATQDGEFVIRTRVGEVEALVIIVYVRIFVFTDGGVLFIVVAALLDSVVDVGLIVTRAAALIDALSLREGQKREISSSTGEDVRRREDWQL